MFLGNWIDREPEQFEYLHRVMAYTSLTLILIVYYFTYPDSNYQIYVPIFLMLLLLFMPKISSWLEDKYNSIIQSSVFLAIDIIVTALFLSAVHLNLVLSLLAVFALLYTVSHVKISWIIFAVSSLFGILLFSLCNIFIFGAGRYFQSTSTELTVLAFLCLISYFWVGGLYQARCIRSVIADREHYAMQMQRYIKFSNQLSRYAPSQLWQSIMKGESEAKIEYKRKKMTIFFSDIQGFTELSESLIADDLAFLLNDYLSHMTEIAQYYGATVDKFMGDAILIFFGAPQSQGMQQDAKICVDMALAMRQQMKLLRERWVKMGYPALHIRMGMSTGYCHVGNYGTEQRMAYTIVGRDVNLAERLQNAAEIDQILIAEDTYKIIKDHYLCIAKPSIYLKGIQQPVKTWQVMEKLPANRTELKQWFDYEYKGFHLLLDLEEVQNFEYPALIEVLESMIQRIQLQQSLLNADGVAKLHLEDEIVLDTRSSLSAQIEESK